MQNDVREPSLQVKAFLKTMASAYGAEVVEDRSDRIEALLSALEDRGAGELDALVRRYQAAPDAAGEAEIDALLAALGVRAGR